MHYAQSKAFHIPFISIFQVKKPAASVLQPAFVLCILNKDRSAPGAERKSRGHTCGWRFSACGKYNPYPLNFFHGKTLLSGGKALRCFSPCFLFREVMLRCYFSRLLNLRFFSIFLLYKLIPVDSIPQKNRFFLFLL